MSCSAVLLFISSLVIYALPWLKQRRLYRQPSMFRFNTRFIGVLSRTLLVYLVVSVVGLCLLIVVPLDFRFDPGSKDCVQVNSFVKVNITAKVFYFVSVAGFVVNQVALFDFKCTLFYNFTFL